MAVTKLCETFGRRYTSSITGAQTATRIYIAICNTSYTDLDDLITDAITAGLPTLGTVFSGSAPNLVLEQHVPIELDGEKAFYNIECRYSSNSDNFASPTSRPWDISFYSISQEWVPDVTQFDTTGLLTNPPFVATAVNTPILNTAAYSFVDPPVTDFRTMYGIRLNKKFTTISGIGSISTISQLMSYTNTINDATNPTITIAGITGNKYTFWMESIECVNTESNGEDYYDTTFNIIYDPRYHTQKILNCGWQWPDGTAICGENGGEISQPWPLDIAGVPIEGVGATPAAKAADRASKSIYLNFGIKPTANWTLLGLPSTF